MSQRRVFSTTPSLTSDPPRQRIAGATPGAGRSPQMPGQVPDRSGVPGHGQLPVPPTAGPIRPLSQFGTAQEILGVYAPDPSQPGQETDPARFEQATAAFEELRKADPALLTPIRPLPGYDLDATPALTATLGAPGEMPALAEGVALDAEVTPNAPPITQAARTTPSDAVAGPGADQAAHGGALSAEKDGKTDVMPS
jgi:hypothetical protein